jgi:hypothetical protein
MTKPKELQEPRRALFLKLYTTPNTNYFSNIYQSAVKAGFSKEYAENMRIDSLKWVSEAVGTITKDKLVEKSKRVLNKSLDSEDEKLAQDTAKFIAKTDVEFSEKQDPNAALPQMLLVKFIGGTDE